MITERKSSKLRKIISKIDRRPLQLYKGDKFLCYFGEIEIVQDDVLVKRNTIFKTNRGSRSIDCYLFVDYMKNKQSKF